ncbi:MAG: flagellar protein FlgN [Pseudomonadota bacterium]
MADQTCARILAVLDDERAAIRQADYGALDRLAAEKETLFRALHTGKPADAELAAIKERIDQNQTLLSAAIKGVAEAQSRLSAMRTVREGLSVYDKSGQVSNVKTGRSELEKKA